MNMSGSIQRGRLIRPRIEIILKKYVCVCMYMDVEKFTKAICKAIISYKKINELKKNFLQNPNNKPLNTKIEYFSIKILVK